LLIWWLVESGMRLIKTRILKLVTSEKVRAKYMIEIDDMQPININY